MKQKRNPLTGRWNIAGGETSTGPLKILVVDSLPGTGQDGVIYIVEGALYSTMYVRDSERNIFIKVGTTQVFQQEQSDWLEQDPNQVTYIKNKPILAEVAYTGSYEDLEDQPEIPVVYNTTISFTSNGEPLATITLNQQTPAEIEIPVPTKTSDLENDSGFINKDVNNLTYYTKTSDLADVALSNDYEDLDNKPTIPTKLSDLTNDMGFIDNTTNNLINYWNKTNSYSKTQIDEMLAGLSSLRVEIVTELPNPGEFGVIYLIETGTPGVYNQYILTDLPNTYAMIGSTSVDLTNYFNKVTDTADSIREGDTNLFMTEAERINLSHQSGYNTGDETKITIQQKLGPASATNDGYLLKEDRSDFDHKAEYEDYEWTMVTGPNVTINDFSQEVTTGTNIRVNVGTIKEGLVYVLKVNATSDMTVELGDNITNPNQASLNLEAGKTKIFVMLATSDSDLIMQGVDFDGYARKDELADVAFTGEYADLHSYPKAKITFTQGGEEVGSFRLNQTTNETIDIVSNLSTNIYTTVDSLGVDSPTGETSRSYPHGLGDTPGIINVDLFAQIGDDQRGRHRATRALVIWQNGETSFQGTVLNFGNSTKEGGPSNMTNLPITIQANSSRIYITVHDDSRITKFRITAYL